MNLLRLLMKNNTRGALSLSRPSKEQPHDRGSLPVTNRIFTREPHRLKTRSATGHSRVTISDMEHAVRAKKNIFLTGAPSSGKTTIIKKILRGLDSPANGFYTEEVRILSRRVGFMMHTIDGRQGYLAHEDIKSDFRIRRYGVSIENIESVAVPSITPAGRNVIILDEIGKMECYSERFRRAVTDALDSPNIVLGTITFGGDFFIREIKRRPDMDMLEVTPDNRDALPALILARLAALLKAAP